MNKLYVKKLAMLSNFMIFIVKLGYIEFKT